MPKVQRNILLFLGTLVTLTVVAVIWTNVTGTPDDRAYFARWGLGAVVAEVVGLFVLGPIVGPSGHELHRELRWRVAQKLALQWSPQQISGWLKQEFPTHQDMQISHEAIYRSFFIQTRGVLKKEFNRKECRDSL